MTNGVSRRRFVEAAGASGVALGLSGCISSSGGGGGGGNGGNGGSNGGGGGSDETETQIDTSAPTEDITVTWAATSREADNIDTINEALHNAGLPENITVEVIAGSQVTDNRQAQYQQWLGSNRAEPTILMMDSGWTIPFIARDSLLNLSQALPSDMIDTIENEYFGASVETAKGVDGALYAQPLFPDFPTMQYRKDLLEQSGYGSSDFDTWAEESMSWEQFSEITKQVMGDTNTEMGFSFQASVYEGLSCCDFNEFMTSWGGAYFGAHENLFGPVGDRPITVDEQAVIDSIRMIRTFIYGSDDSESLDSVTGDISPEAVLQWTEEPSRQPFTNGEVVMHRNWPYSININGAEDAFGEDLGVMPIPYGVTPDEAKYEGTGGPVAALGGWHIAMNPNAPDEQKSAAVQVMRAMMADEVQLTFFETLGLIPPKRELLNSSRAAEVPVIGRYLPQLRVAGENAVPRPVTIVWPQQSGRIAQQVNTAYAQDKTPEKAMADLKEQLESIESSA